jgi:hypothetical protein
LKGVHRVHVPAVVHFIRGVLAAGAVRAHSLSLRVAAAASLPDRWHRRARSVGSNFHGDYPALQASVGTVSDLKFERAISLISDLVGESAGQPRWPLQYSN